MYLPKIAILLGASSIEGFSTKSFTLYTLSSICIPFTIPYYLHFQVLLLVHLKLLSYTRYNNP